MAAVTLMHPSTHHQSLNQSPGRLIPSEPSVITAEFMEVSLTAILRRTVMTWQGSSKLFRRASRQRRIDLEGHSLTALRVERHNEFSHSPPLLPPSSYLRGRLLNDLRLAHQPSAD